MVPIIKRDEVKIQKEGFWKGEYITIGKLEITFMAQFVEHKQRTKETNKKSIIKSLPCWFKRVNWRTECLNQINYSWHIWNRKLPQIFKCRLNLLCDYVRRIYDERWERDILDLKSRIMNKAFCTLNSKSIFEILRYKELGM